MSRILSMAMLTLIVLAAVFLAGDARVRGDADAHHFTLLHTNDEHSALLPHSPLLDHDPEAPDDTVGGFARLAGALRDLRGEIAAEEAVLTVSAGDFIGGTPFAWLALEGRAPELDLMQHMGYDVVILGNHEFDAGPETLAEYLNAAGYPAAHDKTQILSGNAAFPSGHQLVDKRLLMTTVISPPDLDLDLGFFSVMGEHPITLAPGAAPVHFEDPLEFARKAVARLQEEGVDLIIAITHSGLAEDRQLAREIDGVDVIVGGHCHTALHEPLRVNDTIIVQAGAHTEYLGCLQLAYDEVDGSLTIRNPETGRPHLLPLDDDIDPCPEVAARVESYTDAVNATVSRSTGAKYDDVYEVIGRVQDEISNVPERRETPYGNLIADAFRWSVQQHTEERVDFAFQANGQIRGPLQPSLRDKSRGHLSLYEVVSTVGMGHGPKKEPGYSLVSVYLTGDEVRRVLEISHLLSGIMGDSFFQQVSGLRHTYDPDRASLLQLPIVDQPLPTYRAVLHAERYLEADPQMKEDNFTPLQWDDGDLYHVVVDTFVASFVPMVGDMLPRLAIEPKDSAGRPIQDLETHIVYHGEEPLTAWRAVADYISSMPRGPDGVPEIPELYTATDGRQVRVETVSLLVWPIAGLLLLIGAVIYLLRRRRSR